MKRIFALVLTIVMVLAAFAGCRSGKGEIFDGFARASYIRVFSGEASVNPIGYVTWAKIDNGGGKHTETVFDRYSAIDLVSGKTDFPVMEIPRMVFDGEIKYAIQINGRVEKVYLITQSGGQYTESETTFEALSDLADGTYYVAVEVLLKGTCDPDSPQNSYRYETVFCLVVGDTPEPQQYDRYKGTYNRGDRTVELKNVSESDSSIQLNVRKIHIENKYDPENSINIELISSVDQEVTLYFRCQQGGDNFANMDQKLLRLKKDEPTTVELDFGGWPKYNYWLYIDVGFTKVEIEINPK